MAKRYSVSLQVQTASPGWVSFLVNLVRSAYGFLTSSASTTPPSTTTPPTIPPAPPQPTPPAPTDALAAAAASWLGKDASPKNLAPQEVSCAEGVSNIAHSVYPDFPAEILSTADLEVELQKSTRFTPVLTPQKGCVIVSPRTPTINGHTGIFISDTEIASNSSATGKFEKNYTFEDWVKMFKVGRGLHVYLYRPL
jgi:hypothetical protein